MEHLSLVYTVIAISVALVGMGAVNRGIPELGVAIQALRSRPIDPSDVTEGPVVVRGTPTPLTETVEAHLTEEECIAFDATLERQRWGRHNDWEHVDRMARGVPFEIRGPSGAVKVDPAGADIHMKETYRAVTGERSPPPKEDTGRRGLSSLPFIQFNWAGDYRYVERRLDPTDTVTVFGVAEYDSAADTAPDVTDGGGDVLSPPFAVYASDGANPARLVPIRVFGLVIGGLLAFGAATYVIYQLYLI